MLSYLQRGSPEFVLSFVIPNRNITEVMRSWDRFNGTIKSTCPPLYHWSYTACLGWTSNKGTLNSVDMRTHKTLSTVLLDMARGY